MKKISIHSAFIISVFLFPQLAIAQVAITEIMYDPHGTDSGHEWIEVYNEGTSSVPFTSWKLGEGDSNHGIYSASASSTMLAPAAYAVIAANAAKFQSDYPAYAGPLFHASLSLNNSGETLTLRDRSKVQIDSVAYDSAWGAIGDGNSLQRVPGDTGPFLPRTPTPGFEMSPVAISQKTAALTETSGSSAKSTKLVAPKSSTESRTKSKSSPLTSGDASASNDAGNMAVINGQAAAAAQGSSKQSFWWVALAGILFVSLAAIAAARHYKKSEWDIIEESPDEMYSDMI